MQWLMDVVVLYIWQSVPHTMGYPTHVVIMENVPVGTACLMPCQITIFPSQAQVVCFKNLKTNNQIKSIYFAILSH